MIRLKTYISSLLLIVAVFYSIDLHGLSHAFEDNHSDNSNHCELCIINHQKDQSYFALHPNIDDYEFIPFIAIAEIKSRIRPNQNFVKTPYFLGQFLNKPPPSNT